MVHPRSYPTRPKPGPALHLLHGRWVASCPSYGYQLATARSQERCDRQGRRRACPICQEVGLP
jgi:cytochrome c2